VIDEFLQELHRPIRQPWTRFGFSFRTGRLLFRNRRFVVLFNRLRRFRLQPLLLDVVVRLDRFHQLRYFGIGQRGLRVVRSEAWGAGCVPQLVIVGSDLDGFRAPLA
jgi:hypothetical protein